MGLVNVTETELAGEQTVTPLQCGVSNTIIVSGIRIVELTCTSLAVGSSLNVSVRSAAVGSSLNVCVRSANVSEGQKRRAGSSMRW